MPGFGPHSYWRVFIGSSDGGGSYVGIYSLDFQDASGTSLCVGGTPFASSQYSHYAPANAFPGGSFNWISNAEVSAWLAYQFTSPVDVKKVVLAGYGPCPDAPTHPLYMELQYSDDGSTWHRAWVLIEPPSGWVFGNAVTYNEPDFSATSAPWWLMHMELNQSNSFYPYVQSEMRFLDASGAVISGFSNTTGCDTDAGNRNWANVWDGDQSTEVHTASVFAPAIFGIAEFPSPVAVYGLKVTTDNTPFNAQYCVQSGEMWHSTDGLTYALGWAFDPSIATGYPAPGAAATVTWNYTPPPPPNLGRRGVAVF